MDEQYADRRASGLAESLKLEARRASRALEDDTSSESTGSDLYSTEAGRAVLSDFDAAMTTSMDYGYTPHHEAAPDLPTPRSRGARSARSYQPSYAKSPLQNQVAAEESASSDSESESDDGGTISAPATPRRNDTRPDHNRTLSSSRPVSSNPPPIKETIFPSFDPYSPDAPTSSQTVPPNTTTSTAQRVPENRVSLVERQTSVTPRNSGDLRSALPQVEPQRLQKCLTAVNDALDWARTLTEGEPSLVAERDAVLSILFVISNRLQQGTAVSRHVPLYRSLYKTLKQLTRWSQEVVSHRAQYQPHTVSLTLRGFIQKCRDFNTSLGIEADPNTIAEQLNSRIQAHNSHRAESDAMRQALKQKLREEKLARKEERARIRTMHEQLRTLKRAHQDGIEITNRLGGMVSREAIRSPPPGTTGSRTTERPRQAPVEQSADGEEIEARSIITNEDEEPQPRPTSDTPTLSSLGEVLPPRPESTRRTSPDALPSAKSAQDSGPRSYHSSQQRTPRTAPVSIKQESTPSPHAPRVRRSRVEPSEPSSKPLPHRPFSRTDVELLSNDDGRSETGGTEIVEGVMEMEDGERAPSVSYIQHQATGSAHLSHRSQNDYQEQLDDDFDYYEEEEIPTSPRSKTTGVAPPINVEQSERSRSRSLRSGSQPPTQSHPSGRSQRSHRSQQSQKTERTARSAQPPPNYQNSNPAQSYLERETWKSDLKEKEQMALADEELDYTDVLPEDEEVDEEDEELVRAFNRVVNVNNARDMIDQRAIPQRHRSTSPDRAYQPPAATVARTLGVEGDLEGGEDQDMYGSLSRSGSALASSALHYRKTQSRSQPPGKRPRKGTEPRSDQSPVQGGEYDYEQGGEGSYQPPATTNPYPTASEQGWLEGSDPADDQYQNHGVPAGASGGVRVRMYETVIPPGIHEVLSPEFAASHALGRQGSQQSARPLQPGWFQAPEAQYMSQSEYDADEYGHEYDFGSPPQHQQIQHQYQYNPEMIPIPPSSGGHGGAEPETALGRDRSTTSTHTEGFVRAPRIFQAMAEAEERERAMAKSAGGGSGSRQGSSSRHNSMQKVV